MTHQLQSNRQLFRKAARWGCGLLAIIALYYIVNLATGFALACPTYLLLHLYCPGCGVTRMMFALLRLDFYQAFRSNPLVFVLLILGLIFYCEYLYSCAKGRESWYQKIPNLGWGIIIAVVILYGVLRNLPWFVFLAPI